MDAVLSKYYSLTPKQRKEVAEKFQAILNENDEIRKKKGKTDKYKKIDELKLERDISLFNRLRAWRNKTAEEAGLDVATEAWQIMRNDLLMNAAFYRPENKEEFLKVYGMSEEVFANYGSSILEIITGKALPGTGAPVKERPVVAKKVAPKKAKARPAVSTTVPSDDEEGGINIASLGRLLGPNKN